MPDRFKLRPLIVGCGRGGRTGDEPPSSAVELLEYAGLPGTGSSGSGFAGAICTSGIDGRRVGELGDEMFTAVVRQWLAAGE